METEFNGNLMKTQLIQLDILKELDDFCKQNNIKYQLYAGTLLGAIRHNGYIPWDDDIDIAMKHEDYEALLKNITLMNCIFYKIMKQTKNTLDNFQDFVKKILCISKNNMKI